MRSRWIILLSSLMLLSCVWLDDKLSDDPLELVFTILPQLNQNGDGYYVLPINSEGEQITNHTVYTYVGARDYNELEYIHTENKTVHWLSNLFWVILIMISLLSIIRLIRQKGWKLNNFIRIEDVKDEE